jgi:hypothetical protein
MCDVHPYACSFPFFKWVCELHAESAMLLLFLSFINGCRACTLMFSLALHHHTSRPGQGVHVLL